MENSMPKFKAGESRNQMVLFPETINEYIPEGHLAKLVLLIVSSLNIDVIISKFSNVGQRAFSPRTLLSILFYGYSVGIRSSRKLSKACEERVDFMYLTGKLHPSHKTISEFRRENLAKLSELFQEILLVGIKLDLVTIGNIKLSIDGTKIRANASGKLSKDEKGLEKLLSDVKEKVAGIMKEAEEVDQKENLDLGDRRGDELPKELKQLEIRKDKITCAIQELRKEKAELKNALIEEKNKNGKKGTLSKTEEKKIGNRKINITDHDARYMKERNGCIRTNYNAQASVDEENQFIVACDVTTECNDKKQLLPMIGKSEKNLDAQIDICKADSGYHSGDNLGKISGNQMEALIDDPAKQRVDNDNLKYDKVNFKYNAETDLYICPEGKVLHLSSSTEEKSIYKCKECLKCSVKPECTKKAKYKQLSRGEHEHLIEQNRAKLISDEGRKEYQKRMHTVEPVFGNIKFNLGFRQFLVRGAAKVKGEFDLMCIAHNIKKIATYCDKHAVNLDTCLI
jgi:transposase